MRVPDRPPPDTGSPDHFTLIPDDELPPEDRLSAIYPPDLKLRRRDGLPKDFAHLARIARLPLPTPSANEAERRFPRLASALAATGFRDADEFDRSEKYLEAAPRSLGARLVRLGACPLDVSPCRGPQCRHWSRNSCVYTVVEWLPPAEADRPLREREVSEWFGSIWSERAYQRNLKRWCHDDPDLIGYVLEQIAFEWKRPEAPGRGIVARWVEHYLRDTVGIRDREKGVWKRRPREAHCASVEHLELAIHLSQERQSGWKTQAHTNPSEHMRRGDPGRAVLRLKATRCRARDFGPAEWGFENVKRFVLDCAAALEREVERVAPRAGESEVPPELMRRYRREMLAEAYDPTPWRGSNFFRKSSATSP